MPKEISIDMLNKSSREQIYLRKNRLLFRKLAKETHFNLQEVHALALIHEKMCKQYGKITKIPFRDIFHSGFDYTENVRHALIDNIFTALNQRNTLHIDVEQWIRGMSIMLRGSINEKINFSFNVYDPMTTGIIKREQIFNHMHGCFINLGPDENVDENLREFVHLILRNLDVDRDGIVSMEDFKTAIMTNNELLLECMGPIFPSRDARYAFSTTFTNNVGDF